MDNNCHNTQGFFLACVDRVGLLQHWKFISFFRGKNGNLRAFDRFPVLCWFHINGQLPASSTCKEYSPITILVGKPKTYSHSNVNTSRYTCSLRLIAERTFRSLHERFQGPILNGCVAGLTLQVLTAVMLILEERWKVHRWEDLQWYGVHTEY
jgi:hypothetical protein